VAALMAGQIRNPKLEIRNKFQLRNPKFHHRASGFGFISGFELRISDFLRMDRLRNIWLPRFCFAITSTLALGLAAAVVVTPWLLDDDSPPLVELFAQDVTVRRTAMASSACMFVTACVFFRASMRAKKASRKPPSPGNMAGA
jgi:hypothetical protein